MKRATSRDLLYVTKSKREDFDRLKGGVSLERRTGYTILELQRKACLDRYNLAKIALRAGHMAFSATPPLYRAAIGRAYYSMYHAARAVVFFISEGDDYQEHSKLPGHLPSDFPSRSNWENDLKTARLERNKADYDPYPRDERSFLNDAHDLLDLADQFLTTSKNYLRSKGC